MIKITLVRHVIQISIVFELLLSGTAILSYMYVKDGHGNLRKVNYSYEIIALAEFIQFKVTKMLQRNKSLLTKQGFLGSLLCRKYFNR